MKYYHNQLLIRGRTSTATSRKAIHKDNIIKAIALIVMSSLTTPAWSLTVTQKLNALQQVIVGLNAKVTGIINTSAALNDRVTQLEKTNSSLTTQISVMQNELSAIKSNTVLELNGLLYLKDTNTATFEGVNVQVVNGSGKTNTVNGLGNLIIGYNESFARTAETPAY
jgi:hypothetical protein